MVSRSMNSDDSGTGDDGGIGADVLVPYGSLESVGVESGALESSDE